MLHVAIGDDCGVEDGGDPICRGALRERPCELGPMMGQGAGVEFLDEGSPDSEDHPVRARKGPDLNAREVFDEPHPCHFGLVGHHVEETVPDLDGIHGRIATLIS